VYVLGYIDRREIVGIYDAKIQFNLSLIRDLTEAAEKSGDPLSAAGKLRKARSISRINEEYARMVSVINTAAGQQYLKTIPETARQIEEGLEQHRTRLRAAVVCPVEEHQRISVKLREVLQGYGFTITDRNPVYTVNLRVSTTEEKTPAIFFVRSAVDAEILLSADRTVLFSYNRSLPRYGHATMEGAYGRAYLNIERDLEDNFIRELNAVFGN
jgi:hypothetical protein